MYDLDIIEYYIKHPEEIRIAKGDRMKTVVSVSGGRNSTAMLLLMLKKRWKVDDIVFCDTGVEYPEMYDYINTLEEYIGRSITRLYPKESFEELFYSKYKSGKHMDDIHGFVSPFFTGWCTTLLKINVMKRYVTENKIGQVCLGLTFDEQNRISKDKKFRYPLIEMFYTTNDCVSFLKDIGMDNPLYKYNDRTGCWCCPKQSTKSLAFLFDRHPDLWNKMLQYAKDSPIPLTYDIFELDKQWRNQPKVDKWIKTD